MNDISCPYKYPIFCIRSITDSKCLVSGGGGAAKTGVENKIDVVNIRRLTFPKTLNDLEPEFSHMNEGIDTYPNAVMRFVVLNSSVSESGRSFTRFITLEGSKLVDYMLTTEALNEEVKFRKISELDLNEDLSSISVSNFVRNRFLIVGTADRKVILVNIMKEKMSVLKSISVNFKEAASVSHVSFAPCNTKVSIAPHIFVALCDRPDAKSIRLWTVKRCKDNDEIACDIKTEFGLETTKAYGYQTSLNLKNDPGLRFKHCEFLETKKCYRKSQTDEEIAIVNEDYLLASIMPICYTMKRTRSTLSIWKLSYITRLALRDKDKPCIDYMSNCKDVEQLDVKCIVEKNLDFGQIPACFATTGNDVYDVIAMGTMEGHIFVYLLLPNDENLVQIYTKLNAHSLFITSLDFMPERRSLKDQAKICSLMNNNLVNMELVSVSADQLVKWHAGPSVKQLSDVITFDGSLLSYSSRKGLSSLFERTIFLIILFAPVVLQTFESLLNHLS